VPDNDRDPKFHFLRDIENHLLSESLPAARESLGDWILRSNKNAEATEAAEEDSRRIDDLLNDRTRPSQAVRQDEQQQLDETLSQAAVLRKECDRQLAELSRRAQLLELKKQAILRRITVKFYGYSLTRLKILRPSAKDFASEDARRQFAQHIGDRLCPETSLESRAAKRVAEIIKLGKRYGIDDERVANWILGGISLVAIRAEILDEFATRSDPRSTSAEIETPAPRTDGNNSGAYDRELAEVFRLGIRGRVDRDQIADSIEKYWTPELTAAEFIAGVSGLRRLTARPDRRSIVGEIFELFGDSDGAWAWKDAYVQWLLSKLEQLADEEIIRASSSGQPTTDLRTQQIGDRVISHLPPRSGTPAQQTDQGGSRISSPEFALSAPAASQLEPGATPENPAVEPEHATLEAEAAPEFAEPRIPDKKLATVAQEQQTAAKPVVKDRSLVSVKTLFSDLRSQFIVEIMVAYPKATYSEICAHADVRRQMRIDRNLVCPREQWIKESGETRAPKDWMRDDDLWAKVFAHKKTHHKVEQWLSVRKKKLEDN
jgi:hypothetical protein